MSIGEGSTVVPEERSLIDFLNLIDRLGAPPPTFGTPQLHDILSWSGPVEPILYARLLSALIGADPRAATITACANAIAAVDCWRELVFDLLAAADPGASVIGVLWEVLRARGVEHPLAAMAEAPQIVMMISDAQNHREGLLLSAQHRLPEGAEWLLLATADPIGQVAAAVSIEHPEGMLLAGLSVPWFEQNRFVCPAFFVLADGRREE